MGGAWRGGAGRGRGAALRCPVLGGPPLKTFEALGREVRFVFISLEYTLRQMTPLFHLNVF